MENSKGTSFLSICITVLLVDFFLLFRFATADYVLVYFVIIFIATVLMNALSRSKGFILIASVILSAGFVLTFTSKTDLVSQTYLIGEYLLLMGALLFIWLLFSEIKKNNKELNLLELKVKTLEKNVGNSNLLTNSEFGNLVKIISTGTKRRNEKNYFLSFSVENINNTTEAMSFLLEKTLLETVRADFDLVTQFENHIYLVFLQNTKEKGCEIVSDRLFQTLQKELNTEEIPVTYKSFEEKEGLEYFEENKTGESV